MPRKVFNIVPDGAGWAVERGNGICVATFALQGSAIADARRRAMASPKWQIWVHRLDQGIEQSICYG